MFDYLIKGVLQEQFQRFKRDTNSRSNDMIFIKELIYGGSLLGSEVPQNHIHYGYKLYRL